MSLPRGLAGPVHFGGNRDLPDRLYRTAVFATPRLNAALFRSRRSTMEGGGTVLILLSGWASRRSANLHE
jgi:hypothetical protein